MMTGESASKLREALRPTGHRLTRPFADRPIGGPEYTPVDRVVQEIDGLGS